MIVINIIKKTNANFKNKIFKKINQLLVKKFTNKINNKKINKMILLKIHFNQKTMKMTPSSMTLLALT